MTAPLAVSEVGVVIGKRIKDCEDGTIYTIIGIDDDGDYILYYEGDCAIYCGREEVHGAEDPHLCICKKMGWSCDLCMLGVSCWDCYIWLKENE